MTTPLNIVDALDDLTWLHDEVEPAIARDALYAAMGTTDPDDIDAQAAVVIHRLRVRAEVYLRAAPWAYGLRRDRLATMRTALRLRPAPFQEDDSPAA